MLEATTGRITTAAQTERAAVTVTFLRTDERRPAVAPQDIPPPLPLDCTLVRVRRCTVPFYRFLYATVGAPYLWWLRRVASDEIVAAVLSDPGVSIHVLYRDGEPAGFFELERRTADVNLSYFGLMPHVVGKGLGPSFLAAALDAAWVHEPKGVTVNTCTADHPRALPTYLRAGFRPIRSVREVWDIPVRLGLIIPIHLRA